MTNEAPSQTTQAPNRHLGHAILDLILRPILHTSRRHLLRTSITLFTSLSLTHRIMALTIFSGLVLASYQESGFFPTPNELTTLAVSLTLAFLLIFAVVALVGRRETAGWLGGEAGWLGPWAWVPDLSESECSEGTTAVQDDAWRTPTGASPSALPAPADAADKQDMEIPPTPLPRSMRSVATTSPSTPAHVHRSGLLGASPMPPRFLAFGGNPFARRADARAALNEWSRPGATAAEKAKALKVMETVMAIEREDREDQESWVGGCGFTLD